MYMCVHVTYRELLAHPNNPHAPWCWYYMYLHLNYLWGKPGVLM